MIDTVRYDVLNGHALRLDTVGVVFDFTALPYFASSVTFYFVDRSPLENMQVENSTVHLGQITDWPSPQGGHTVVIGLRPFPNHVPTRGKVGVLGDVDSVRVGGANDAPGFIGGVTGLWLDTVCANRVSGQQQNPNPL